MSQWRRLLRDVDDGKRERLRGHIQLWIRRMLIAAGKPPMDELLRIVAAVAITLAVAALAVVFFMWVFS